MKDRSTAYSAFISYASANRDKAEQICASLEERGLVCWIAPRNVRAGREYGDEIIQGLERSAAVVVVLSEAANTSVFVLREIERAVSKDINVVPVRIEEVTPSPGLELFISGTHWLDVWRGNWNDHMDRLVRDLDETPAAGQPVAAFARRRSFEQPPSLRKVHVAAGLALVVALSGIAIWSYSRGTQEVAAPGGQAADAGSAVVPDPTTDPGQVIDAGPPAGGQATDPGPAIIPLPTTTIVREPEQLQADATRPGDRQVAGLGRRGFGLGGRAPAARPPASDDDRTSRDVATSRPIADTASPVVDTSGELNALRDDYDNVSLRGGVIDDALNQLWEEMKPNSPRLDMVTHQRSLRTNLTRIKDALADRDVAGARRYLASAREDLEALERFLNR
jgi:hypothetical protein